MNTINNSPTLFKAASPQQLAVNLSSRLLSEDFFSHLISAFALKSPNYWRMPNASMKRSFGHELYLKG